MYGLLDARNVITAITKSADLKLGAKPTVDLGDIDPTDMIGRQVARRKSKLRIAIITNWAQDCGISTYSQFLVNAIRPLAEAIRVFSEFPTDKPNTKPYDDGDITYCWTRGTSMLPCTTRLLAWQPDFIIIQHEFGIFPKAPYILQLLQMIDYIPYIVTLHSVYMHLDKTICTSAMRNMVVHSEAAKNILRQLGHNNRIDVIQHGCVSYTAEERKEHWNIFNTSYVIIQFGFGFKYKGVDRAIDAIKLLKTSQPNKYAEIFYLYLCSENPHTMIVHNNYYDELREKVHNLDLEDNVVIIRKYHTELELNNYLRTAKLAIFPYLINEGNVVYGASGAIRIAMANGIPVIASENHLFDELPVPRPDTPTKLASEIDKVFSRWEHRKQLIADQDAYIATHSWPLMAERYIKLGHEIREQMFYMVN